LLLGRKFAVVVPEPPADGVVTLAAYRSGRSDLVVHAVDATTGAPLMHELAGSLVAPDGMVGGLGMFAGPGLLVFHAVPSGLYRLSIEAAGFPRVSRNRVEIGAPGGPTEIRVALARAGRVAGRVTCDADRNPESVSVQAVPASKEVMAIRAGCAPDGTFALEGLSRGTWRISAEVRETSGSPTMTTRPEEVTIEPGKPARSLALRLLPVLDSRLRLNGVFATGDPPTMDRESPGYRDMLFRVSGLRIRCRDDAGVCWVDRTIETFSFRPDGRDLIVRMPLPEGTYALAVDLGDDEIGAVRIPSPGTAEISVPDF
jgi:hypothetical protein